MSDLVVIGFPTEAKAEEVRQKLLAMQKEYLLELDDAVVAVKNAKGNIKLNQLINMTTTGAVSGTFWGTLIGLIFLMPLVGAAVGAASGALGGALTDLGINDKWMKETAAAIAPGSPAPGSSHGKRIAAYGFTKTPIPTSAPAIAGRPRCIASTAETRITPSRMLVCPRFNSWA